MTTATTDTMTPARGAERGPAPSGLPQPVGPGVGRSRRQQLPWIALGVLSIVMSMLGFTLWSAQQDARSPALVAGRTIAAGETIQSTDLVVVEIGAGSGMTVLGLDQEDVVVGRVARGPIPMGTPLSSALVVAPSESVPEGGAVVGLLLEPGQYPTGTLRAGDRVGLVVTGPAFAPSGGTGDADPGGDRLAEATVWSVEPVLEGRRQLFVSLLVAEASADAAADAASSDRVRLVLLRAGG